MTLFLAPCALINFDSMLTSPRYSNIHTQYGSRIIDFKLLTHVRDIHLKLVYMSNKYVNHICVTLL